MAVSVEDRTIFHQYHTTGVLGCTLIAVRLLMWRHSAIRPTIEKHMTSSKNRKYITYYNATTSGEQRQGHRLTRLDSASRSQKIGEIVPKMCDIQTDNTRIIRTPT